MMLTGQPVFWAAPAMISLRRVARCLSNGDERRSPKKINLKNWRMEQCKGKHIDTV
jgi:hypothetical protein